MHFKMHSLRNMKYIDDAKFKKKNRTIIDCDCSIKSSKLYFEWLVDILIVLDAFFFVQIILSQTCKLFYFYQKIIF